MRTESAGNRRALERRGGMFLFPPLTAFYTRLMFLYLMTTKPFLLQLGHFVYSWLHFQNARYLGGVGELPAH
jgi:hypothetical protein